MKIRNTLMAVILAVFTSSAANAAVVNYGSPVTGGAESLISTFTSVAAGQSGIFFTSPGVSSGTVLGTLANNLKVTFYYEFIGLGKIDISSIGDSSTSSYSAADSINGTTVAGGGVFATANVTGVNGVTSVSNVSGATQNFTSFFLGKLKLYSNVGNIHYNVSTVPLPTSVLMFGAALAAMFAFSRKQRKASSLA